MRISWSLLKAFESKNYEQVEAMLFGLPSKSTEAMKKGSDVHEYIARNEVKVMDIYDKDTTQFEDKKNGINYFVLDYGKDKLVCVIDTLDVDQGFIVDYKVSKSGAGSQDKRQLFMYNWILSLAKLGKCKDGYMVQIDPSREVEDVEVLSIARYDIEDCEFIKKWVDDTVAEIKSWAVEKYGIQA